jgi:hypothetical protein
VSMLLVCPFDGELDGWRPSVKWASRPEDAGFDGFVFFYQFFVQSNIILINVYIYNHLVPRINL